MDRAPVTDEVIRHWREKASDRPTVVFCSTVAHAENVAEAFNARGTSRRCHPWRLWTGRPGAGILAAYASGEDPRHRQRFGAHGGLGPSADLLRRAAAAQSYKSTMIQMVGRGLRTVDPESIPGRRQDRLHRAGFRDVEPDHGTLEQDVDLDGAIRCPGQPRARLARNARRRSRSPSPNARFCGADSVRTKARARTRADRQALSCPRSTC